MDVANVLTVVKGPIVRELSKDRQRNAIDRRRDVRSGEEHPARRPSDAANLLEEAVRVANVFDHLGRNDRIETRVDEGEGLAVCQNRGLTTRGDVDAEILGGLVRERDFARPDFEDAAAIRNELTRHPAAQ